jgi:arylsulfatase A-like enzyme
MFPENADGKRGGVYSHDLMTREALEFVANAKSGQPFFLYLAYTVPHFDLDAPEDSMAQFRGKWDETPKPKDSYMAQPAPRAAYAAMITRMDRDVGRLMALLKEKGIDKDTLVIFTSDNGPTLLKALDVKFFNSAAGLRGLKEDVYEGGIRVPFVARWPGRIEAGKTSDFAGAFWDVMPTLAELAGTKTPAGIDGLNFAPTLLSQPGQKQHEYLSWEFGSHGGQQAVRMGDWKGVRTGLRKNAAAPVQLYDLKSDVAESRDVASEHPEIVAKMSAIMKDRRVESDVFPLYKALPAAK